MALEESCFEPARRDSPAALKASLANPKHEVWVAREKGVLLGSLFLRKLKRSIRIHSIAVAPSAQGRGLGTQLMRRALQRASASGVEHITLEADANNRTLLDWYAGFGFKRMIRLPGYYGRGRDAIRMRHSLSQQ